MSEKLKPVDCPYCGNKAIKYDGDWEINHKETCWLYKENQTTWLVSKRDILKWNTRSHASRNQRG